MNRMKRLLVINVLVILFSFLCTYLLIASMYYGKSFPFLNKIITGQDAYPLSYYVRMGYAIILNFAFIMNAIIFIYFRPIVGIATVLLIAEIYFALCFVFPQLSALIPRDGIRTRIYYSRPLSIVPKGQEVKRYDPEVTYILEPNSHYTVIAPEYRATFNVNSMGLRDDEESLVAPDIIVLGDSEAMGWAVEQHQTYAHIIEEKSGLKVLNAGIDSFATVREMRLLNRLDTSNLKYLIIDYHPNDYQENKYFFDHKRLDITPREEYERLRSKKGVSGRGYYPGKYVIHALIGFMAKIEGAVKYPVRKDESKYFLNALLYAGNTELEDVKIITIGLGDNLTKEIRNNDYPDYIKNIIRFDYANAPRYPQPRYRYTFDDHRNVAGYEAVASGLLNTIRKR